VLELQVTEPGMVRLRGRLDAAESPRALETLERMSGPLTLDCSELEYISSAGISVILETFKRLSTQGSRLSLVEVLPRVRNVFMYAGLDKVLDIS